MKSPRGFGPGFLVAAAFIGPGTVTTASMAVSAERVRAEKYRDCPVGVLGNNACVRHFPRSRLVISPGCVRFPVELGLKIENHNH